MQLLTAGIPGIFLGVICCLLTGLGGYLCMRLIRSKHPEAGGAIGTTAGNAATPASLAEADTSLAPYATAATAQMAASCIVTAILCPIFVNFLHRYEVKRQAKVAAKKAGKA